MIDISTSLSRLFDKLRGRRLVSVYYSSRGRCDLRLYADGSYTFRYPVVLGRDIRERGRYRFRRDDLELTSAAAHDGESPTRIFEKRGNRYLISGVDPKATGMANRYLERREVARN